MILHIIRNLDKNLEKFLLTLLYLQIFLVILLEVFQRFVLRFSTVWGEEIARYCFIYMVWVAASLCAKERIHLKIDFITNFFSNRGKSIIALLGELITLALALFCIKLSMNLVLLSFEFNSVTDGLRVVKGIFLFSVPFGFSILILRILQNIKIDIVNIIYNNPPNYPGNIFEG